MEAKKIYLLMLKSYLGLDIDYEYLCKSIAGRFNDSVSNWSRLNQKLILKFIWARNALCCVFLKLTTVVIT